MAEGNQSMEDMRAIMEELKKQVATLQEIMQQMAPNRAPPAQAAPVILPVNEALEQAYKSKVDRIESMLRKTKGMEDYILDVEGLCLFPEAKLPDKFKMPEMEKFDGTGDPKTHVRMYVGALKPMGISNELMAQLFQRTLSSAALRWFLTLDPAKTRTFEDIINAFVAQYAYNIQLDVTTRELETTRQNEKETFVEFLKRWRAKAAMMTNRPTEKDQVRMVIKNLLPHYVKHLIAMPIATFEQLFDTGNQVEDAIRDGILDKGEIDQKSGRTNGSVSAITTDVNTMNTQNKVTTRHFSHLGMSLSAAMNCLVNKGHLKPLDPIPPPNPLPHRYNPALYCAFHQSHGHATDKCSKLHHEIQNLIDDGIIAAPIIA